MRLSKDLGVPMYKAVVESAEFAHNFSMTEPPIMYMQKLENEKKAAIAEAEKVVAAAKGKADANRILQQSITPELIQLKAVEKWDGKLPLSTGGNTLPFLKLQ